MQSVVPGKEKGGEKEVSTRQSKGEKQQFGVGGEERSAGFVARVLSEANLFHLGKIVTRTAF